MREDGGGSQRSSPYLGWALVMVVACVVRLAYLATARGTAFDHPLVDADYYDMLGVRLAHGEGFPDKVFWQPPLYPLFLGGLYRLFGHSLAVPRLVQAALGAGTAALSCEVARRITRKEWAGRVAGLLVALHGPLVFYDGELLPTSLSTFLAVVALWLSVRDQPTWRTALGSGVAVGLGAIASAPILLLLPAVAWASAAGRSLRPLLCIAAAAVVIAPVTIENRVLSGEWVLISANGGVNLWIGNNPNVDRTMAIRPGAGWDELIDEPGRLGIVTAGGQDSYFAKKAAGFCAESPLVCLRNLGWKARLLLVSRELPRNEDLYAVREQSPVLAALTLRAGSVALPYALLWPLAAAGIATALLRHERALRILLFAALALAAPCILFFVTGRYRAPLAPALAVLSALGVAELLAPRVKPLWAPLALGLGALSLAVWPVRLMVDRINFRAEVEYAAGGRQARLGDKGGAVDSFRRALALRPDYLEAGYNLGLALEHLGRHREAAEAFGAVVARHPSSLEARLGLANALLEAGELATAEAAFQSVVREAPTAADALLGLSQIALSRGEYAAAEAFAARAERASGRDLPRAADIRRQIASRAPASPGQTP